MEYLNVTDSNKPYSYLLTGCPALECPIETFTSIYEPRFPANVETECAKNVPPTPPSKIINYLLRKLIDLFSDDGGNKKLTVALSFIMFIIVVAIVAIFIFVYFRKRERDPPLLSTDSFSQIA